MTVANYSQQNITKISGLYTLDLYANTTANDWYFKYFTNELHMTDNDREWLTRVSTQRSVVWISYVSYEAEKGRTEIRK